MIDVETMKVQAHKLRARGIDKLTVQYHFESVQGRRLTEEETAALQTVNRVRGRRGKFRR